VTEKVQGAVEGGIMLTPILLERDNMPHAIIRGRNGRRHEVDFGDEPVRVEIHSSEETVEIFIEADFETLPEGRRRFAILNVPRHLFSEAIAAAARRAAKPPAKGFRQSG
jgi:hypothetical protein